MKQIPHWVSCWLHRPVLKITLGLLLTGIGVRSRPYLAPIKAQDIQQNQLAFEFSDRNGLPLGTILSADQNHTAIVSLSQVSPNFIEAIIAAEDKRYYQHGALDLIAIARSLLEAVQAQEIVSGASTITMQLARMLEPSPRTFFHKLGEIWLSWRLTAGMTKNEILEAYFNRLPMGGNLYGIEAAAQTYFGIPASDLNLAQASLLAALPNDPTDLNPYTNWQDLKQRQRYVLNRMVEDQYITSTEAERAFQETLKLQPKTQGIIAAPHFLFWLSQQLSPSPADQKPFPLYQVKTSLDRPLQQFVEAQVQQILLTLKKNNVNHAAALVIDNKTGQVLAYVGSPDYFNEQQFGRNDGVQALRQPGSTLKPFLYQLALAYQIIYPNTILADVPTYYAIPTGKLYSPTDYDEKFLGPVRVRVALANSLNIPAVKVLEKVTVPVFLDRLKHLGFKHLNHPPEYYGLGLTLGSGEVNLWELAQAYVTLANQGQVIPLTPLLKADLEKKRSSQEELPKRFSKFRATSFQGEANAQSTMHNPQSTIDTPQTWQLITDMLSDAQARASAFGIDSVLNLPFPVAVKTGTSSDYRDTWTVGFTTDYTVATWVGNFDGTPMQNVSGVMGAAPLWNQIMLHLHQTQKPGSFSPPTGLIELPICATSGLRPTPDCPSGIVLEYFAPESIQAYQNSPENFTLNAEYNEWLSQQSQNPLTQHQLRILSPQNNDYFLLNPEETSRLQFKIINPTAQPVEWQINGEKLTEQSSNSYFWILRPGIWTLTVKQGNQTDQVQFEVAPSNSHSHARGFSVVNPNRRNNP